VYRAIVNQELVMRDHLFNCLIKEGFMGRRERHELFKKLDSRQSETVIVQEAFFYSMTGFPGGFH
jgi:hypothetical protein